jgi:transposase
MELTQQQYNKISDSFPRQRGNVKIDNLTLLNAILYLLENGCKWRCLPERFGNWHSIYTRMNRWSKNGVLDRILGRLQENKIFHVSNGSFSLDSTVIKVHPDGTGALKKTALNRLGNPVEAGQQNFI